MPPVRLGSVVLGACALGTLVLFGCNKETPPAAEEPRSASNAAAPQAAPSVAETKSGAPAAAAAAVPSEPAVPAVAKVSDASFDVSLEAPKAPLKAGQAGTVEVLLVAKAPFHVNDKYPIKMKLKETPGVKYANLVVGKDAAKVEAMKATMPLSFTPEAGKRQIAGQFLFSVCTDDKCLMEKRDLVLDVVVD